MSSSYSIDSTLDSQPFVTNTLVSVSDVPKCAPSSLLQARKRVGVVPALVLATTLAVSPATAAPVPFLPESARSSSGSVKLADYVAPSPAGRRISLGEARQMALRAHRSVENALKADREQEARLQQLGSEDDFATEA